MNMRENRIKRIFVEKIMKNSVRRKKETKSTGKIQFACVYWKLSLCALGILSMHCSQWAAGQYSQQEVKSFYLLTLHIWFHSVELLYDSSA